MIRRPVSSLRVRVLSALVILIFASAQQAPPMCLSLLQSKASCKMHGDRQGTVPTVGPHLVLTMQPIGHPCHSATDESGCVAGSACPTGGPVVGMPARPEPASFAESRTSGSSMTLLIPAPTTPPLTPPPQA